MPPGPDSQRAGYVDVVLESHCQVNRGLGLQVVGTDVAGGALMSVVLVRGERLGKS